MTEQPLGQPLGVVPLEGRGSLPFALVHGESLVAAASWALRAAGVQLVDLGTPYDDLRDRGRPLVVHDALCPLTPPAFLEEAVAASAESGAVVVGVRPVTDTVKEYDAQTDRVGRTQPRDELMCVTSPVVLPPAVVAALDGLDSADLASWVAELAEQFPVQFLEAPALGRRVTSADDLTLLEALSRPGPAASR